MNENTVIISTEEYKKLIAAQCFANQLMNLLESKAKKGESIYSAEIETLCLMMGVAKDEAV